MATAHKTGNRPQQEGFADVPPVIPYRYMLSLGVPIRMLRSQSGRGSATVACSTLRNSIPTETDGGKSWLLLIRLYLYLCECMVWASRTAKHLTPVNTEMMQIHRGPLSANLRYERAGVGPNTDAHPRPNIFGDPLVRPTSSKESPVRTDTITSSSFVPLPSTVQKGTFTFLYTHQTGGGDQEPGCTFGEYLTHGAPKDTPLVDFYWETAYVAPTTESTRTRRVANKWEFSDWIQECCDDPDRSQEERRLANIVKMSMKRLEDVETRADIEEEDQGDSETDASTGDYIRSVMDGEDARAEVDSVTLYLFSNTLVDPNCFLKGLRGIYCDTNGIHPSVFSREGHYFAGHAYMQETHRFPTLDYNDPLNTMSIQRLRALTTMYIRASTPVPLREHSVPEAARIDVDQSRIAHQGQMIQRGYPSQLATQPAQPLRSATRYALDKSSPMYPTSLFSVYNALIQRARECREEPQTLVYWSEHFKEGGVYTNMARNPGGFSHFTFPCPENVTRLPVEVAGVTPCRSLIDARFPPRRYTTLTKHNEYLLSIARDSEQQLANRHEQIDMDRRKWVRERQQELQLRKPTAEHPPIYHSVSNMVGRGAGDARLRVYDWQVKAYYSEYFSGIQMEDTEPDITPVVDQRRWEEISSDGDSTGSCSPSWPAAGDDALHTVMMDSPTLSVPESPVLTRRQSESSVTQPPKPRHSMTGVDLANYSEAECDYQTKAMELMKEMASLNDTDYGDVQMEELASLGVLEDTPGSMPLPEEYDVTEQEETDEDEVLDPMDLILGNSALQQFASEWRHNSSYLLSQIEEHVPTARGRRALNLLWRVMTLSEYEKHRHPDFHKPDTVTHAALSHQYSIIAQQSRQPAIWRVSEDFASVGNLTATTVLRLAEEMNSKDPHIVFDLLVASRQAHQQDRSEHRLHVLLQNPESGPAGYKPYSGGSSIDIVKRMAEMSVGGDAIGIGDMFKTMQKRRAKQVERHNAQQSLCGRGARGSASSTKLRQAIQKLQKDQSKPTGGSVMVLGYTNLQKSDRVSRTFCSRVEDVTQMDLGTVVLAGRNGGSLVKQNTDPRATAYDSDVDMIMEYTTKTPSYSLNPADRVLAEYIAKAYQGVYNPPLQRELPFSTAGMGAGAIVPMRQTGPDCVIVVPSCPEPLQLPTPPSPVEFASALRTNLIYVNRGKPTCGSPLIDGDIRAHFTVFHPTGQSSIPTQTEVSAGTLRIPGDNPVQQSHSGPDPIRELWKNLDAAVVEVEYLINAGMVPNPSARLATKIATYVSEYVSKNDRIRSSVTPPRPGLQEGPRPVGSEVLPVAKCVQYARTLTIMDWYSTEYLLPGGAFYQKPFSPEHAIYAPPSMYITPAHIVQAIGTCTYYHCGQGREAFRVAMLRQFRTDMLMYAMKYRKKRETTELYYPYTKLCPPSPIMALKAGRDALTGKGTMSNSEAAPYIRSLHRMHMQNVEKAAKTLMQSQGMSKRDMFRAAEDEADIANQDLLEEDTVSYHEQVPALRYEFTQEMVALGQSPDVLKADATQARLRRELGYITTPSTQKSSYYQLEYYKVTMSSKGGLHKFSSDLCAEMDKSEWVDDHGFQSKPTPASIEGLLELLQHYTIRDHPYMFDPRLIANDETGPFVPNTELPLEDFPIVKRVSKMVYAIHIGFLMNHQSGERLTEDALKTLFNHTSEPRKRYLYAPGEGATMRHVWLGKGYHPGTKHRGDYEDSPVKNPDSSELINWVIPSLVQEEVDPEIQIPSMDGEDGSDMEEDVVPGTHVSTRRIPIAPPVASDTRELPSSEVARDPSIPSRLIMFDMQPIDDYLGDPTNALSLEELARVEHQVYSTEWSGEPLVMKDLIYAARNFHRWCMGLYTESDQDTITEELRGESAAYDGESEMYSDEIGASRVLMLPEDLVDDLEFPLEHHMLPNPLYDKHSPTHPVTNPRHAPIWRLLGMQRADYKRSFFTDDMRAARQSLVEGESYGTSQKYPYEYVKAHREQILGDRGRGRPPGRPDLRISRVMKVPEVNLRMGCGRSSLLVAPFRLVARRNRYQERKAREIAEGKRVESSRRRKVFGPMTRFMHGMQGVYDHYRKPPAIPRTATGPQPTLTREHMNLADFTSYRGRSIRLPINHTALRQLAKTIGEKEPEIIRQQQQQADQGSRDGSMLGKRKTGPLQVDVVRAINSDADLCRDVMNVFKIPLPLMELPDPKRRKVTEIPPEPPVSAVPTRPPPPTLNGKLIEPQKTRKITLPIGQTVTRAQMAECGLPRPGSHSR